jgi:hypothetical protein
MILPATILSLLVSMEPSATPPASCAALEYSFTPDCFREAGDVGCVFHADKPDLGPQIAVWVERGDGGFVDTLMLTNATALFGIGNRPGEWDVRSGPRFPYGRRQMALPVWAHARGKTYPLVVMQDGDEQNLGTHEEQSSPEPHFCRPMLPSEVVDAVTCPSGTFRSDKGRLDTTSTSFYPPRADLFDSGAYCPPVVNNVGGSCDPGDSAQYPFLNDVDTVAAATPLFGVEARREWILPSGLAAGPYALVVEVGKEYDTNDAFDATSAPAVDVPAYGQGGNLGQPSVIYRVPFTVGAASAAWSAAATSIAGYGDATGATGTIFSADGSVSSLPGSGEGRLATTDGPGGAGRVHVTFAGCEPFDCTTHGPPAPVAVEDLPAQVTATTAVIRLHEGADGDLPVLGYDVRLTTVEQHGYFDITMQDFTRWTPVPGFEPAAPDSISDVTLTGLIPATEYVVGVVAHGRCGDSAVSFDRFVTPRVQYTQLHGCFIATAAYGSALADEVNVLRVLRDRAVGASDVARVAVELYYRSGPAAARALAATDVGRAVIRRPLGPIAAIGAALVRGF